MKKCMKKEKRGAGMCRAIIKPKISKNTLTLGALGKGRKNKIVFLKDFSFDLLPQKWFSIRKFIDDNKEEKVEFWYEL